MTLSDFATFSTAISGFAVTASLIYLALQTHQSVKHTRALIHQGRIARIGELAMESADADVTSAIIIATGGTPTPEEVKRRQFNAFCAASFYGWQDSFSQHRKGLLDEDIFIQMRAALVRALSLPAVHAEWQNLRVPGTKFAAFVDEIITTLPKWSTNESSVLAVSK